MAMSSHRTVSWLYTANARATSGAVFLATDACHDVNCSSAPGGAGQACCAGALDDAAAPSAGASPRCGGAGVAFAVACNRGGAKLVLCNGTVGRPSWRHASAHGVAAAPPLATVRRPLCTNGRAHCVNVKRPSSSSPNVASTTCTLEITLLPRSSSAAPRPWPAQTCSCSCSPTT